MIKQASSAAKQSNQIPAGPHGYLRLLRQNRDFRRLYLAQLISMAGDWFLTVPLLDLVLQMTGSAGLASLIIVCGSLPIFLFIPWAGAAVDHYDRRRLMIGMDLARTGAALLPLLARSPAMLPFAFVGVIAISIGAAYFDPASNASLPNLVTEEELAPATALMGSTWGTMLVVGAALGGLVTIEFGRDFAFVFNSASFLISALLLKTIKASFRAPDSPRERPSFKESMRETYLYARGHKRVLALLSAKGGFGIGAGAIVMLGIFGRNVFRAGAVGIGALYAARGLGALVGPFLIRSSFRRDDEQYRLIGYCGMVFGLGYAALALSPSLALGCLVVFIAHLGGGGQWLVSTYGIQRETPDYVRGRVFAVDYGLVTLTTSASSLIAGFAADRFGPVKTTAVAATMSVLWGVTWTVSTVGLWRTKVPQETRTSHL